MGWDIFIITSARRARCSLTISCNRCRLSFYPKCNGARADGMWSR